MKPKEKNCVICEKKFKPKVANSLCCSDKCRSTRDAKYEKSRKKRDWAAYEKTRTRDQIKKTAYMKKYYKLHKDEIKLWRDNYYKENKERILEHNRKYRASRKNE